MTKSKIIEWKEEYSVGVEKIDKQHQKLILITNQLNDHLNDDPRKEEIDKIINQLIKFKKEHFATEEEYFKEFDYKDADIHTKAHKEFSVKIKKISEENQADAIAYGFALIDFLEDWLIGHLMTMDQDYVKCFHQHGLK